MDTKTTQISKKTLKELFTRFSKKGIDVGLCGGWSVNLALKKIGVQHLASEDIDIFFKPSKTPEKKILKTLEEIGFMVSKDFEWTWVKYFNKKTMKNVSREDYSELPFNQQGTFYIDILPTESLTGYLEEELLDFAFGGEHDHVDLNGVEIMIPSTRLILSIKSSSAPQRRFTRKQAKDIADIYAIIENDENVWENGKKEQKLVINYESKKYFADNLESMLDSGAVTRAEEMLGTKPNEIYETLKKAYKEGEK